MELFLKFQFSNQLFSGSVTEYITSSSIKPVSWCGNDFSKSGTRVTQKYRACPKIPSLLIKLDFKKKFNHENSKSGTRVTQKYRACPKIPSLLKKQKIFKTFLTTKTVNQVLE